MTMTERVPLIETRIPLKSAMRHLAGAVSVVTAGIGDERTGATVTTAHSLSVEPEVMVVSINLNSSTWAAIRRHRHFCVNVLRADQIAIADRFAGRDDLKGWSVTRGPAGLALRPVRWHSTVRLPPSTARSKI